MTKKQMRAWAAFRMGAAGRPWSPGAALARRLTAADYKAWRLGWNRFIAHFWSVGVP